jgi:hypothetical protein
MDGQKWRDLLERLGANHRDHWAGLKYGPQGFYARYQIELANGDTHHADGQIFSQEQPSGLNEAPRTVVEVNSIVNHQWMFNGSNYEPYISKITIEFLLDDGWAYRLVSNVHGYVDTNNPPTPVQKGDTVFPFKKTIVVVDASGMVRELPYIGRTQLQQNP